MASEKIYTPFPAALLDAVRSADEAVVIGHSNPDGDCIFSQLACGRLLGHLGKKVTLLNQGPFQRDEIRAYEDRFLSEVPEGLALRKPLVIVVDCSTFDRPGQVIRPFSQSRIIVLDHHSAGERFTSEDLMYIRPQSVSTSLIVDHLREELGVPLDAEMADYIYRGFATDTGFFHFISEAVGAETLERVAGLVAQGVSPYAVYDEMHDGRALEDIRNTALITAASRSELGGRLITAYQGSDMKNARLSDGVYASLLTAAGVKAVVFIKDKGDALEIGFRSKNRSGIDVGAIAAELGGGGHSRAAGATITGYTPTEAREMLIERFRTAMEGTDGDSCV